MGFPFSGRVAGWFIWDSLLVLVVAKDLLLDYECD